MEDIVERLRMSFSPTRDLKSTQNNKLHRDAADEIERLREDKAELLKAITDLRADLRAVSHCLCRQSNRG